MSLSEFVKHLYGDTEGLDVADWDSAGLQFRQFRDHNKDGFIDKDELMVGAQYQEDLSLITLTYFRSGSIPGNTIKTRRRRSIS